MIDSRAIIDPSAEIADDVEIGPWTIVGPDVEIGAGSKIASHVVVKGPTRIGSHNQIYQFSTIGEDTPDMKYKGEPTRLEIGDHNIIREGVTVHRGTVQDKSLTRIGNHNLLMAYSHIGHDCVVGDHVILVNHAALAGHVLVGDWAILSGYTLVHQHCRVGAHAYAGMASHIVKDVPAYMFVLGQPAVVRTFNVEGLKRRDFSKETIATIKNAYRTLYRRGLPLEQALQEIKNMSADAPALRVLVESVESTKRGILN
ncbi:MAG: acyl-ACP--UDP-N-acetylglucosamine O-acyltransferase [Pseudomonadales bacterium]